MIAQTTAPSITTASSITIPTDVVASGPNQGANGPTLGRRVLAAIFLAIIVIFLAVLLVWGLLQALQWADFGIQGFWVPTFPRPSMCGSVPTPCY